MIDWHHIHSLDLTDEVVEMLLNDASFSQDRSPWQSDFIMVSNKINRFYYINTNEISSELSSKNMKIISMCENKKKNVTFTREKITITMVTSHF